MFGFSQAKIERNLILLGILTLITISIGGLVQIIPLFAVEQTIERVGGIRPYTPLELAGRDIYVREGCYTCHSQMVRPFRDERERYGHYSLAAESMYDHPFQWGSKRTGPDLARVGGRYSDEWQVLHLRDPRSVVPASIMPAYGFLDRALDYRGIADRMATLRAVGVPYTDEMVANARADLEAQARPESDGSGFAGRYARARQVDADADPARITEMDALVAYLQMLGTLVDFSEVTPQQLRQQ
ncbi:cytochrome-c oxidase, cbb3-type subunit II [Siccirubricoccus sp. KC 17139]|uniref:Cytochrome-c oxidase, cbb3-type subunit II n=1 Tax=Siccirubricoccus soli TaxID=2899147 RepID=A0ABT1D8H2_9PROT|nr:cytochrome-c oxidase, cbb3-type subunit II [Siccirubricoccus soli]MCO6417902.1 cytochrome-c oxidase, cbb3-type subunit II [Siccirubricoccus soli]MCP2684037.1 cytochrome-c oxidase, cbb3-type subunit II [Siccirubricoccus soli]